MISHDDAEKRRDIGMERSVEHADREISDWSEQALVLTELYASIQSEPFLTEQVRAWACEEGLPKPPDDRAWGAVIQMAARKGYLIKAGYAAARSSNLSPKVLWRASPHA